MLLLCHKIYNHTSNIDKKLTFIAGIFIILVDDISLHANHKLIIPSKKNEGVLFQKNFKMIRHLCQKLEIYCYFVFFSYP